MEELNLLAGQHIFIITVLLAAVIFILLIMLVMTRKKLAVMQDKYDYFTKGSEVNIDQVLTRTLQELEKTQAELQQLQQKHGQLREQVKGCIQKVKMERYDAFDAMGGEMSYSILLADEPTGALDAENSERVFQILLDLRKQEKAIVFVTHNMELAKRCILSIP